MARYYKEAEVCIGNKDGHCAVISVTNIPEKNNEVVYAISVIRINNIYYRPAFYFAEGILHFALLPEEIYNGHNFDGREITPGDWVMTLMLNRDSHFQPTLDRTGSFQEIEIASHITPS